MLHNPNGRKFGLKRLNPSHTMVEDRDCMLLLTLYL